MLQGPLPHWEARRPGGLAFLPNFPWGTQATPSWPQAPQVTDWALGTHVGSGNTLPFSPAAFEALLDRTNGEGGGHGAHRWGDRWGQKPFQAALFCRAMRPCLSGPCPTSCLTSRPSLRLLPALPPPTGRRVPAPEPSPPRPRRPPPHTFSGGEASPGRPWRKPSGEAALLGPRLRLATHLCQ